MNLKRWTGILLICAAAFMALALFVMWGLPVLFPPEDPEDSLPQATVLPTASPAASTEENDLPVLEDSVNLFVINEDHPADADFAPEETAEFDSVTVDARIVPALTALCDAAKADGGGKKQEQVHLEMIMEIIMESYHQILIMQQFIK